MEENHSSDERSYRRGLVLGLTMAEVVILLIFALLLVWMIGLQNELGKDKKVQELNRRVKDLQEQVDYLAENTKPGNQFDDLFRELKLKQEEAASLRRPAELLKELGEQAGLTDASPERIAERIRQQIQIAGKLTKEANGSPLSLRQTSDELAARVAALAVVQEALKGEHLDSKQVANFAESATLLRELGRQTGGPDASPEEMAQRIRDRLQIAEKVIEAAKGPSISGTDTAVNRGVTQTVADLLEVQKTLGKAGLEPKQASTLAQSAGLLRELGQQAGAPYDSPEQMAESIREQIKIASTVTEAAKSSSLSNSRRNASDITDTIARLTEVQEGLQAAGLDAKQAAALGQSAKLLRELGQQAGVPNEPPDRIAEEVRERIRIANGVIDAARVSGVPADQNQQLAATLATLSEVQQSLEGAGLDTRRAATLTKSAKLLRELGQQAGIPDASPEKIAERLRQQIQIAGKIIDDGKASALSQTGQTRDELAAKIAALTEVQDALSRAHLDPKRVANLVESTALLRALGDEAGAAHAASNAQIAEQIRDQIKIAGKVIDTARASPLARSGETKQQLAELLSGLIKIRDELQKAGVNPDKAPALITETRDQLHEKESRLRTLQGRLKYTETQLQILGRGTEKPACWADPETGKPEYIFDIALQSTSLSIRDNALPHRREEQAKLPLRGIRFGSDLKIDEFRAMTGPLFLWSEKEGCRFFVRVFDLTQAHEKNRYKIHLRTVGEHFYYYEELNRPWTVENTTSATR